MTNLIKYGICISMIVLSFQGGIWYHKSLPQHLNFVDMPPKAIHEWPDKICYSWEGKYKTQIITCIRGIK